ncbi:MAG TPA: hypothetical protein VKT28_05055 [Puia sp.]|nr:hypothetical protein [Puia sp.]
MKKIKHFFSKDFRVFLPILGILTWALSILTLLTFIVTMFGCATKYSLAFPSSEAINTFLSIHKNFYQLYGATLALIIAYLAVKQYLHSNTLQTLDFFYEKLVPAANKTINIANEKLSTKLLTPVLIEYLKNNQINFTSEELNSLEPKLRADIMSLHSSDLDFQTNYVLTLGYFESFSIKLTRGLVDYNLIKEACSKAFCVQVRTLYPLISITRSQNDKSYFTTVVHLFNNWKYVLAS